MLKYMSRVSSICRCHGLFEQANAAIIEAVQQPWCVLPECRPWRDRSKGALQANHLRREALAAP